MAVKIGKHCKCCHLLQLGYLWFLVVLAFSITAVVFLKKEYLENNKLNTEALSFVLDYLYVGTGLQVLASLIGFGLLFWLIAGKYSSILLYAIVCCNLYIFSTSFVRSIVWLNLTPTEKATDMKCCGVSGYPDYEIVFDERRVPDHCCKDYLKGCGYEHLHQPQYYLVSKLHHIDIKNWASKHKSFKESYAQRPTKPKLMNISRSCKDTTPNCDKLQVDVNDTLWLSLERILRLETDTNDPVMNPGSLKERDGEVIEALRKQILEDLDKHKKSHQTITRTGFLPSLNYDDLCHHHNFNHEIIVLNKRIPAQTINTTKQTLCLFTRFNVSDVTSYYHNLVEWEGHFLNNRCYETYEERADGFAKSSVIWSFIQFTLAFTLLIVYTICFWNLAGREYFLAHPLPIWFETLPGDQALPSDLGHRSQKQFPPYLEPNIYNPNPKSTILFPTKRSGASSKINKKTK